MAEYRLHCFAQSGNAYKAALMLELCGADWEPRFVDYFNGETRTPEFRAVNVMGEVPLLEHGALELAQSGVILDYLAGQLGQFGPENESDRREILRWLLFDNHKLTSYTATLRFLLSPLYFLLSRGQQPAPPNSRIPSVRIGLHKSGRKCVSKNERYEKRQNREKFRIGRGGICRKPL